MVCRCLNNLGPPNPKERGHRQAWDGLEKWHGGRVIFVQIKRPVWETASSTIRCIPEAPKMEKKKPTQAWAAEEESRRSREGKKYFMS